MNQLTQSELKAREAWNALQNAPSHLERWQQGAKLVAEAINTHFFCAAHHPLVPIAVTGNGYFCPVCRCVPERMVSADCPEGYYLVRANTLPDASSHISESAPEMSAETFEIGDLVLCRGEQGMVTGIDLLSDETILYKVFGQWVETRDLCKIILPE